MLAADRAAGGGVAARWRPGDRVRLSLPLSMARIGVATKIDEYDAGEQADEQGEREVLERDRAEHATTPTTSSESTGRTAARLVLSDRISTWFIDRLTIVAVGHARCRSSCSVFSWTLSNTTIVS